MPHLLPHVMVLGLAALASHAAAAPVPHQLRPDITLDTAARLLDATMDACHVQGRTLAVAVVDRGGNLIALKRDDNVGPHNTIAAQRKAFTALSTKTTTSVLAENARTNPQAQNLTTLPELLLLGGGVPLKAGADVIGAIGVAGAGGASMDESCALTGIARIAPISPTKQE